ncbi:MAG: hypothetical protein GX853_05870, partial [Chloroflexi bacterium]|nr:hypothetical protein [Chloroflexota bacterium]
ALQMTTMGKRIGFDPRSRQRQFRAHMRLNYLYSMAEKLRKADVAQLTEDIIEHLKGAEEHLAEVFGAADLMNIRNLNRTISLTHEPSRKALAKTLGEEQYNAIAESPIDDIPEEMHEEIQSVLGYETQNRIYRDLLLGTFTESWVEYLTEMEALRVSIRMESYAQRDPLVQYKHKASGMYSELMGTVRQTVVSRMFRFRPNLVTNQEGIAHSSAEDEPQTKSKSKKKRRKRH